MAFNGSGVFIRLYNWVNDKAANIKVRADRMDAEMDGMATGLSTCITKDGQTTVTANLPMATFKHTNVGNATSRNEYAALGQVMDGKPWPSAVGGTGDVITLTYSPSFTAYTSGMTLRFVASGANTTNVTVNVDSLGAKALTKKGTMALVAGDIPSGAVVEISYDGTQFQILNVGYGLVDGTYGDIQVSSSVSKFTAISTLITGKSAETSPATDDLILVSDTSESAALNKMTLSDMLKVVNSLTEDTTPVAADDFLLEYDASASGVKKVKISNLQVVAATQAEQETASSTAVFVSPGRQQFHPSAAKAWVRYNTVTTTTITSSYNVSSLTDNGTGDTTVNFTTAFSGTDYAYVTGGHRVSGQDHVTPESDLNNAPTASAFRALTGQFSTLVDSARQSIVFYGDQ